MIVWQAGKMAALGIAIGLAASALLGKFVESQLSGVRASNPAVLACGAALLAVVAAFAALAPGWRASKIEPVVALKYE